MCTPTSLGLIIGEQHSADLERPYSPLLFQTHLPTPKNKGRKKKREGRRNEKEKEKEKKRRKKKKRKKTTNIDTSTAMKKQQLSAGEERAQRAIAKDKGVITVSNEAITSPCEPSTPQLIGEKEEVSRNSSWSDWAKNISSSVINKVSNEIQNPDSHLRSKYIGGALDGTRALAQAVATKAVVAEKRLESLVTQDYKKKKPLSSHPNEPTSNFREKEEEKYPGLSEAEKLAIVAQEKAIDAANAARDAAHAAGLEAAEMKRKAKEKKTLERELNKKAEKLARGLAPKAGREEAREGRNREKKKGGAGKSKKRDDSQDNGIIVLEQSKDSVTGHNEKIGLRYIDGLDWRDVKDDREELLDEEVEEAEVEEEEEEEKEEEEKEEIEEVMCTRGNRLSNSPSLDKSEAARQDASPKPPRPPPALPSPLRLDLADSPQVPPPPPMLKLGLSPSNNTSPSTASCYSSLPSPFSTPIAAFIPRDELQCNCNHLDRIGSGNFGVVYRGSYRGSDVAVKVLKVTDGWMTPEEKRDFMKEVSTTFKYRHENVVLVFGVCIEEEYVHAPHTFAQSLPPSFPLFF